MRPAPPPTKTLHDLDRGAILDALRHVRSIVGAAELQLRRNSIHRTALTTFRAEIDELAGLITGDRTYFHGKPHSAKF